MFKAIILLTRNADASPAEFRSWLLDAHAPLAARLPGIRRLVYNVVETEGATVDGIAELWFDSQEAFEAAYATEIGKSVAADSLAHVSARVRLFVEERAQLG